MSFGVKRSTHESQMNQSGMAMKNEASEWIDASGKSISGGYA